MITTFLNALIDDLQVIFVRPPLGYETLDSLGNLLIWRLWRALYGLRQAPRLWYLEIIKFLTLHGYAPLAANPCVFCHVTKGSLFIL